MIFQIIFVLFFSSYALAAPPHAMLTHLQQIANDYSSFGTVFGSNWDFVTPTDPCDWDGIQCNTDN